MFTTEYDLHADNIEFISPNLNRRTVYLKYKFLSENNDLRLIFVEKQIIKEGRKLTSLTAAERANIFQTLLNKHNIDIALGDIKVLLILVDNYEKSYGYKWDSSNFKVDENIKKLDHDECGIIMKQLEL